MRTAASGFTEALDTGDVETAPERLREALSLVDRGVRQGLIHRNGAARRKSRLMRQLNAATAQAESVAGAE